MGPQTDTHYLKYMQLMWYRFMNPAPDKFGYDSRNSDAYRRDVVA